MAEKEQKIPIVSEDGAVSRVTFFRSNKPQNPVIVCLPAMGVEARYYAPLAENFHQQGFNVVTADLRGHGESDLRPSKDINFGYYEMIQYDWPAIVDSIKWHFPEAPIFLLGHSLGGQLSALYTAENPENITGLILVAACNVYYKGFDNPMKILAGSQTLRIISDVVGYMPGHCLGFAGKEARRMVRDWARNARTGVYDIECSPIDYERLLRRVEKPVLAISFTHDEMAPSRAVKNLYRKMHLAQVDHWDVEGPELGADKFDHFKWVKQSRKLTEKIARWTEETARKQSVQQDQNDAMVV